MVYDEVTHSNGEDIRAWREKAKCDLKGEKWSTNYFLSTWAESSVVTIQISALQYSPSVHHTKDLLRLLNYKYIRNVETESVVISYVQSH